MTRVDLRYVRLRENFSFELFRDIRNEVDPNAAMAPIVSDEILGGFVYHGTYPHNRWSIETKGLFQADRQQIHFFEPKHKGLGRNAGMYVRLDVTEKSPSIHNDFEG